MRTVVAIVTALLLLVSQAGVWLAAPSAQPCCQNCAGACCVTSSDAPVAPQPVAPVSANPAPALKLAPPPAIVCGVIARVEFAPRLPIPTSPVVSPSLPLFLRQCVLLV